MSERRKPGAGTVERLPSGKYRARMWVTPERRETLGGPYDTEEEAEGVLNAARELLLENPATAVGAPTMRANGARFFERRELAGYRNGHDDRKRWNQVLTTAPFADWPLENITTRDVRRWLELLFRQA